MSDSFETLLADFHDSLEEWKRNGPWIVAEKVFRTGLQTLWVDGEGQHYVSLKNRSYSSGLIEIPPEKIEVWKELLR